MCLSYIRLLHWNQPFLENPVMKTLCEVKVPKTGTAFNLLEYWKTLFLLLQYIQRHAGMLT